MKATATQNAIRLSVATYLNGAPVTTTLAAGIASPSGSSAGWVQLSGTFAVPSSGVDAIRLQLGVTSAMSAGTVWFDDVYAAKTGISSNTISGINATANTASTNANTANTTIASTNSAIYNAYFGTGGSGAVTDASDTIAAIKTRLEGGWTIETVTVSGDWTVPWDETSVPSEFWAICWSGGGGGGAGLRVNPPTSSQLRGTGGAGGTYAAIFIDPAELSGTVSCVVSAGAAGRLNTSSNQSANPITVQTSFGSYIATLTGRSFIASNVGYYSADDSAAGAGGGSNGAAGATPLAAAGSTGQ